MTAYVYRCYDADGTLVYVGSTANVAKRMRVHLADRRSRASAWLRACMARYEVEECPDLATALRVERDAIAAGQPTFNIQERGVPLWMTRREVARYLVECGHLELAAATTCACPSPEDRELLGDKAETCLAHRHLVSQERAS